MVKATKRKDKVKQKTDEAEEGTAWCIPLQMTHSLTSPQRREPGPPVGTIFVQS